MGEYAEEAIDREMAEWYEREERMDEEDEEIQDYINKSMSKEQPIQEAEVVKDDAVQLVKNPTPAPVEKSGPVSPTEAKNAAIASLTATAYARAATLKLTKEQSDALQRDFPDEAFKPGAAGKEHLIYIEHAFLRDRLNEVFGLGGWAIVPRNRWEEKFKTEKGKDGSRVYVEAMLVVDGAFVSESVGEMEYYPHNAAQNYGDAVEGAKTAALRRCCKEFGIGLQAWKKDWCEGWWERRRAASRPQSKPQGAAPERQQAASKPERVWTAQDYMDRFQELVEASGKREQVLQFLIDLGWLMPDEPLSGLPDRAVPHSKDEMSKLWTAIDSWAKDGKAVEPYPRRKEEEPKPKASVPHGTINVPRDTEPAKDDEPWRSFPVPFGQDAGVALEDLDKKVLYGWWANFEVTTEFKDKKTGEIIQKKKETIDKDKKFREMLDAAGEHYEFTKDDE